VRPVGVSMLYVKSLSISKFKSFKQASLLFSKGFTCIVGPNGSGKSNICDALLFGLGETSLHRLRVEKLESLISYSSNQKENQLQKAHVKMELDGDEKLEITRVARSDGKSAFRVNGKHMSRQEVIEILRKHKINASETNTITQGEISRLLERNPKERRELIEIAAGIKEFEDKKNEALKELDKVNVKIGEAQIMLNEREGFLKELEKEKEAAEKYTSLSKRLKELNYSILYWKSRELGKSLDDYAKSLASADEEKRKIQSDIESCSAKIDALSAEAGKLTKNLSESNVSVSGVSKRLEGINNELSAIEVQISGLQNEINNHTEQIKKTQSEIAEAGSKIAANKAEAATIASKITQLEKIAAESKDATEQGNDNLIARADAISKSIEKLEASISSMNAELARRQAAFQAETARMESYNSEIADLDKLYNETVAKIADAEKEIKELEKAYAEKSELLKKLELHINEIQSKIKNNEESLIELKEQRALSYQREGGVADRLKSRFSEKDGFYGKASQLCTYEDEYSLAVDAAAGSRLDYIVVDSISTADKIISYMKAEKLGRATFIPIKELKVAPDEDDKRISKLIKFIHFDEKFEKVFQYIFSNTYIIDSIADTQKYGVGKHRYVTLSGDIVEQSGVVSGGFFKARRSLASIESRINAISKELEELRSAAEASNRQLFESRKEIAALDISMNSKRAELNYLVDIKKDYDAKKLSYLQKIKDSDNATESIKAEIANLTENINKGNAELSSLREEQKKVYSESIEASKSAARHGMTKEALKRIEDAQNELVSLKVKKAGLDKEIQMLEEKVSALKNTANSEDNASDAAKKALAEKRERQKLLEKSKAELAAKINESSEANRNAYERLNAINSEIAKLSSERGAATAKLEEIGRRISDLALKKSQAEVRLNDMKAEMAAYTEQITPIEQSVAEMQKEADITTAKISELGNVNLKAPEIYAEKKKYVDEASEKLKILDSERQAVLKMIDEVESKKLRIFTETFNGINKHFSKLYNYIFPGKAEIELDNPKDPFNSGLYMKINDGTNQKRLEGLSGGEKSLVMLMLIFAIHMYKPYSLYIFDEVDYALDKENSKKLSQLIKELSKDLQFILVSHNDSLISNADTAIGVTKVNGESKAFGIEISKILGGNKQ